ncbi:YggS family pyridoxal phosphate-dependent enzyme [Piscinibacter sakaiensis]|uniref:YggS family pyridoxal phosphate-dependent enzyme n=1 Tax=Piscinibacter sakaiensis TaxID=1547922 RepID=UPI003AADB909
MATILDNIQHVRRRIAEACAAAQRPADSVELVCVGKTRSADEIRAAFDAGERLFGENYVQEGLDKIAALADLRSRIVWHLIGPLQSNKTRAVAAAFDWVDSVDRLKIAERLNEHRPPDLPPLQICLQVNISGEASKSGLPPAEVAAVAAAVAAMPRLELRGLMAIPAPAVGLEAQREPHRRLRELMNTLTGAGHRLGHRFDTLSIGMSDDLDAAILEGATMVRIGTAIFGARPPA